jgi:transcriptional regulator with XRE-family HTH domain
MSRGRFAVAESEFGDRVASLRRERGLTQVMLAERVGVHPSQLHRYEAGAAQPTLDVIRRMCGALSVSADLLVLGQDSESGGRDLGGFAERLGTAIETASYLSEHEQLVIAELIEAFVTAHVAKEKSNLPRGPVPKRRKSG